jgi:hypothetical protein
MVYASFILAMRETTESRIMRDAILKLTTIKTADGVAQVEYVPSKFEALSSNTSTTKNK